MKGSLVIAAVAVSLSACQNSGNPDPAVDQARKVVELQQEAWNQGDIEGFMHGYWPNDSLCFIGKNGPTYGWTATLNRYKLGYPDRAAMGHLTFDDLRFEPLGPRHLMCTGQWQLQRQNDTLLGRFTLLFKQINGQWLIVYDHSS